VQVRDSYWETIVMSDGGNVLVVGASRGIGLELVRQYAGDGWVVHATTRAIDRPGPLGEIDGAVQLHHVDVVHQQDIVGLVRALPEAGVNLVIHSSGIYRGHTRDEMMAVNARAPIDTVQALVDGSRLASNARVVLMSSQMGARKGSTGSLGDYGDSKAALNDEFRLRAPGWGLAGFLAIVMHPGWVRTDMGGDGASLSVEDSATGIRRVIAGLATPDHGRFFTWDGREHPW
jgi:NAD(P)-dependent dehydrogenase (short-subunit alcohol dehydrogenase family)